MNPARKQRSAMDEFPQMQHPGEDLAQTSRQFEEKVRELLAIRRIGDALKYTRDVRKVLEVVIDTILNETDAEDCSLLLLNRDTGDLYLKAARDKNDAAITYHPIASSSPYTCRIGEGVPGRVVQNGKPISIPDLSKHSRSISDVRSAGSLLCLPLVIDGETVGVVTISHSLLDAFSAEDERLMAVIADRVAIALNSVQIFDELQQFNTVLEEEVKKATEELRRANLELKAEIAERKRTEQELVRLERLRSLGEMAAGMNHNLNNILVGVLVSAQLLQDEAKNPQVLRRAELIYSSAIQAQDLVNRLHQAVRGEEEDQVVPVQANRVAREAVQAAQPRWKDEPEARGVSIDMVLNLDDQTPFLRGTPSGLYNILLNLIFNAVDALPEGGSITISTLAARGGVQLSVKDTGIGMDEETRRRVFEPFFTTKFEIGTGLGLSTVYSTVIRWGGTINVESAPGDGTTFTLWFPADAETELHRERRIEVPQVRRGRVLVVDDQVAVGEMVLEILRDTYEVRYVSNGRQALNAFANGGYDVALIDLGMPGIPGDQVAREIRQIDPPAVTVLMTGWKLGDGDPRLSAFDFHLWKPFKVLDEVRDVVARAVKLHDERVEADTKGGDA